MRRVKKRKEVEAERVKPPTHTPTRAIDALMGDEEKRKRQKQGVDLQPSYPGSFDDLLRPAWITLLVYSETPHPLGEE